MVLQCVCVEGAEKGKEGYSVSKRFFLRNSLDEYFGVELIYTTPVLVFVTD
jgi:hypothetical protein